MNIFLGVEGLSGLGEDTWWTWMVREFGAKHEVPTRPLPGDVVIQNSILGPPQTSGGIHVGVFWELHPDMRAQRVGGDPGKIRLMEQCASACHHCITHTEYQFEFFPAARSKFRILPLGVDDDLFRPLPQDRADLRAKWGLPATGKVAFWCGTKHPMKGWSHIEAAIKRRPDTHLLAVWKNKRDRLPEMERVSQFDLVSQAELNELMNCADTMWSANRLRSWYVVEWECMAAGLPFEIIAGAEKEFIPANDNPRQEIFSRGWSRPQAKEAWLQFFQEIGP